MNSMLHLGPTKKKQNKAKKSFVSVSDTLKEDFIGVIKKCDCVAMFCY